MKVKAEIYWVTNDWTLIRRIRRKFGLPQRMDVNWVTKAIVDEGTLEALRKGEPEYLVVRRTEKAAD